MTIFTKHRVRRSVLEEFEAPLGQNLWTMRDEQFVHNPISSAWRLGELSVAKHGAPRYPGDVTVLDDGSVIAGEGPDSPLVNAQTARSRIIEEGLDVVVPDAGIRQRALDILIERKKEERRRNDLIARGPKGFWAGAARLGVAFGAGASDPLNAAAFRRK